MDNLDALVGILNRITATVGRISKKTSRYKTHRILIITKILVVNKTNIMLYWHEKKKKKKIQTKIEDFHKINIKNFQAIFLILTSLRQLSSTLGDSMIGLAYLQKSFVSMSLM